MLPKPALSALACLLVWACTDGDFDEPLPTAVTVTYETPRELVEELQRLQSGPCELDCQLAIAGMYSKAYLQGIRQALMFGLSNESSRAETSTMLFGAQYSVEEFESMSDEEFFARQLLHRERTTPSEMLMHDVEIISEERISDTEHEMLIIRSGLPDYPDYEEEDLMSFVIEAGIWKIAL